jgi:hypothetical protein
MSYCRADLRYVVSRVRRMDVVKRVATGNGRYLLIVGTPGCCWWLVVGVGHNRRGAIVTRAPIVLG